MRVNAFCTERIDDALEYCDKAVYCGDGLVTDSRVEVLGVGGKSGGIYIPSMSDEDAFASACDRILAENLKAYVLAAFDLEEAGRIEARYKLSPIMLLHKLGVLKSCTVVGGVCLDNDDLDLMAQESVPLVVLPTAAAGYGHGYAPVCAAVARGIRVGVGTFDGKYNKACSIDYELEFLRLTANADMRSETALTRQNLVDIAAFSSGEKR
ncbi:MAG: hypothetical protein J1G38_06810 [Clostridiales bacterium]|nr:hypothetical protein [Clostridiales bacterium]